MVLLKASYVQDLKRLEDLKSQLLSSKRDSKDSMNDAFWEQYLNCTQYIEVDCTIIDDFFVVDHAAAYNKFRIHTLKRCPADMTNIDFSYGNQMLVINKADVFRLINEETSLG